MTEWDQKNFVTVNAFQKASPKKAGKQRGRPRSSNLEYVVDPTQCYSHESRICY